MIVVVVVVVLAVVAVAVVVVRSCLDSFKYSSVYFPGPSRGHQFVIGKIDIHPVSIFLM